MPNYQRIFEDGYSYFLTVVTHKRNPILIKNIDLLRESFVISQTKYDYEIEAVVILPDHFHLIITPKIALDYPKIINGIKHHFSKHCNPKFYNHLKQSDSRTKEGYKPIWQKRFYEHTIRDEEDFKMRFHYIHFNPVKHGFVKNVKDWEFSSFKQFVKIGYYNEDWVGFTEKIDFEASAEHLKFNQPNNFFYKLINQQSPIIQKQK